MPRVVEHRAALPNSKVVVVRVRRSVNTIPPVYAEIAVEVMGREIEPKPLPQLLPVPEAYLRALEYAERASITVLFVDDPYRFFPPEARPRLPDSQV